MSKAGGLLITAIAAPIARQIERGYPRYIAGAALAGAVIGVGVGVIVSTYLLIPGVGIGAIAGALLGSIPRKPDLPAEDAVPARPAGWRGAVRATFGCGGEVPVLTVVMDHAVFVTTDIPPTDWKLCETALSIAGVADDDPAVRGTIVPFEAIRHVELNGRGGWGAFVYDDRGRIGRQEFNVGSQQERERLVAGIEDALGFGLNREEQELSLGRSVVVPLIVLTAILGATLGLMRLADHWQHAPASQGDRELARLVLWIGRRRIEWIGCAIAAAPFLWALHRTNHRLRRTVLIPSRIVRSAIRTELR